MSTYRSNSSMHLTQTEVPIYGSSRLGYYQPNTNMQDTASLTRTNTYLSLVNEYGDSVVFKRGRKFFELTNHLGNVLVTVSDKKLPTDGNHDGVVNDYLADVINAQDYSSYGALLEGRQYGGTPRFTFNGKQLDQETNWVEYGGRDYLGGEAPIFTTPDPLTGKYAELSPYQYASNSPIAGTDLDGKEFQWFTDWWNNLWGKTKTSVANAGTSFSQNIQTINGGQGNPGGWHPTSTGNMQDQVDERNMQITQAKANALGTAAKATTAATIYAATPFLITAATPALPELFTVTGSSELSPVGSYLVRKTLLAAADAGGQKLVTGKTDWFDVAADYLPAKGVIGKVLLGALQSSVDYQDGKFISIVHGKSLSEVSADALSSALVGGLFGKFDSQLEKAFIKKGVKGDQLNAIIGTVLKTQKDYIESALKTAGAEIAKDKLKTKK